MSLTSSQVFSLRGRLPTVAILLGLAVAAAFAWVAWKAHLGSPAGIAIIPNIAPNVPASKVSAFSVVIFVFSVPSLIASFLVFLFGVFVAYIFAGATVESRRFIFKSALGIGRFSFFWCSGLALGLVLVYVLTPTA